MDSFKGGNPPSSEPLLPTVAQEKTALGIPPNPDNQQRPAPASKMAYVRRAFLVLTLCTLVLFGAASAGTLRASCHRGTANAQATSGTPSLHDLLHRYFPERFRDGVFPSERQALEAVHREDAAVASSIVQLAKRDSTNTTSSSSSSTSTATETSSASTVHTTSSTSVSSSSTSTSSSSSSTSTPSPVTTSSSSPTSTSTSSRSSSSTSGTSSSPSITPSVSGSGTSSSASQTRTSSSLSGDNNTTMTTSTSSTDTSSSPSSSSTRTSKQTVETLTSTAPNGAVVVVTATTYVSPDSPETPAPSSTNRATLQNAAAGRYQGFGGSALAAAIGLAVLLVAV